MSLKKYIPNTITALNLACGVLGVVFALDGRIELAFALMLAAALFDFCDGLAARVLGAYSDMGKELDSLADVVSFGVLPAVMMHRTMVLCTWSHGWICYLPLIFAVFAGLRLARFNVDERQHSAGLSARDGGGTFPRQRSAASWLFSRFRRLPSGAAPSGSFRPLHLYAAP